LASTLPKIPLPRRGGRQPPDGVVNHAPENHPWPLQRRGTKKTNGYVLNSLSTASIHCLRAAGSIFVFL